MQTHYGTGTLRAHTAIIGVSTGGRGAVVVAERYPAFSFCAGLSGTYDLSLPKPSEGEYRIHAIVFGSRDAFPDRWKAEDCTNPAYAEALKPVSLYFAHGLDDRVVDENQLESMRHFLAGFHSKNHVMAVYKAEHGWQFWDAQLEAVFDAMAAAFRESREDRKAAKQ
jgi:S-formylglutathione hydrolase FrmB